MRRCLQVIALGAVSVTTAGCIKPLFPADTPRTQFETYDRMRSRYVPLEEPDVFGSPQPALRARLSQKK
ncbi:MAG: hypothetical protein JNL80_12775 [Phycisphaerae bacterium]|nr:hypothetical protein [Phycisphaerae bacterium]